MQARPPENHQVSSAAAPRLIEQVRTVIRLKHYSLRDVRTTMIYTHVLNKGGKGVRSPFDLLGVSAAG